MAIDSLQKRASVLGLIVPDGTIDQGDRQTILGIYRGILAGLLYIPVGQVVATITARMAGGTPVARMAGAAVTARMAGISISARG